MAVGRLLALVALCTCTLVRAQSRERDEVAQLIVYEEQPIRSVVGNLSEVLRRQLSATWGSAVRDIQFRLTFPDAHFNVTSNGEVVVHSRIDREDESLCPQQWMIDCFIELSVVATPRGTDAQQRFKVRVVVRDVNDNAPVIAPVVHVTVLESDSTQPFVTSVLPLERASDADATYNGELKYRLEVPSDKFELITRRQNSRCEPEAVCLLVKERLDREQAAWHTLRVIVEDGGVPSKSTVFTLNITVLDVNDHTPQFVGAPFRVNVSELAPEGQLLLRLNATDRDAAAELLFRLQPTASRDVRDTFSLDERSGELRLTKKLDFERVREYSVPVMVLDCATCKVGHTASATVTVTVADANDHAPEIVVFDSADVPEHVRAPAAVTDVRVIDRDAANDSVQCTVDPPDAPFALEPRLVIYSLSGGEFRFELVTRTELDRETQSVHTLTIRCFDDGDPQMSSQKHLTVRVRDRNDHAPHIEPTALLISLNEHNDINVPLATFSVLDPDEGSNANVTLSLAGDAARFFNIDSVTRKLFARFSFDRENSGCHAFYNFSVVARDQGVPPLESSAAVSVHVIDVNDNAPRFTKLGEYFELLEHRSNRTVLGRLLASDADASPEHRLMRFAITPSQFSDYFDIDERGQLAAIRPFDRETLTSDFVTITVTVTDTDSLLSSSMPVQIRILDTNDFAPVFIFPNASHFRVNVSVQDAVAGAPLTTVRATDRDLSAHVQYSIRTCLQGLRCLSLFQISALTGDIYLTPEANGIALVGQRFDLRVQASDNDASEPLRVDHDLVLVFFEDPTHLKVAGPEQASRQFMLIVVLAAVSFILMLFLIVTVVLVKFNLLPNRRAKNTRRRGNDAAFRYSVNNQMSGAPEKLTFYSAPSSCHDHITLDSIVRHDERHLGVGATEDDENRISTDDSGKADSVVASCTCEALETEFGHTVCNIHGMSPRAFSSFQCSPSGLTLQKKLLQRTLPSTNSLAFNSMKEHQKSLLRFTAASPLCTEEYTQQVEVFNKADVGRKWCASNCSQAHSPEPEESESEQRNGESCKCTLCCDDPASVPLMYMPDDYMSPPNNAAVGTQRNNVLDAEARSQSTLSRRSQTPQSTTSDCRADHLNMLRPTPKASALSETRTFRPAGSPPKAATLGCPQSASGSDSTVFSNASNVTAIQVHTAGSQRRRTDKASPQADAASMKESKSTTSFRPPTNLPNIPNTFV